MKRVLAVIGAALTLSVGIGSVAPPSAIGARFHLGTEAAAFYMRDALGRKPALSFRYAYGRDVRCNRRVSATRVRCGMSWFIGDLAYAGKGQIWITFERGQPFWNYAYEVTRFNEYCAAVIEADDCTRKYVAR